jgi:hypothetical protein
MALPVYDDEKERAQGHHDDLGIHPQRREAEVDDLENMYNAPSAEDPQHKAPNPAELARREAEGYGPAGPAQGASLPQRKEKKAVEDKAGGELYRDEGPSKGSAILFGGGGYLKGKLQQAAKKEGGSKKLKLLLGAGIG